MSVLYNQPYYCLQELLKMKQKEELYSHMKNLWADAAEESVMFIEFNENFGEYGEPRSP